MQPDVTAAELQSQRIRFCEYLLRHAGHAETSAESGVGGSSRRVLSELRRGDPVQTLRHVFSPDSLGTWALTDEELEARLLIATLFAHHRINSRSQRLNFGASMRILADKSNPEGVEKRFLRLIGAGSHQYRDVLRQCVLLAGSHSTPINWLLLLSDSAAFLSDDEDRRKAVVRSWCQGYYAGRSSV